MVEHFTLPREGIPNPEFEEKRSECCCTVLLVGRLVGSVGWVVGRLVGSVGWSVGWLVRSMAWLVGSVGWLYSVAIQRSCW
jgi:hypothetical protein